MRSVPEPASTLGNVAQPQPTISDEVFRLLVEAVTDYAIFLLGADGRILTWNLGAERIKGYAADEIIGQHFSVFYTYADRADGRPQRNLHDAEQKGRTEDEGWRVRKDGSQFWADVVITALRDPNGALYGFAKVTRDLTERRAAEERERLLLAEQQAREAADEALRARTRFLSIASHELRTPISSLLLSTEALMRAHRIGKLDEARLATSLRRMKSSTERLTTLVNELLDVSRLESERFQLDLVEADLSSVVDEMLERFVDTGQRHRIHVNARPAVAEIDPLRLEQVVTNLIDNALKYSPESEAVDVEVGAVDDGIVLRVTDRGIGIEPDARRWLFEPFGRGDNAAHMQGIGLGLYISQQIVHAHGGRVDVSSDGPGKGATFEVWLPRERGAEADEPHATHDGP